MASFFPFPVVLLKLTNRIAEFENVYIWSYSCDADPSALANYVVALVKKDKPEKDLKALCADQLEVFLQKGMKAVSHKAPQKASTCLLEELSSSNASCRLYRDNRICRQTLWKSDNQELSWKSCCQGSTERRSQTTCSQSWDRGGKKRVSACLTSSSGRNLCGALHSASSQRFIRKMIWQHGTLLIIFLWSSNCFCFIYLGRWWLPI